MKVSQAQAVQLFEELGYVNLEAWKDNPKRIQMKLVQLPGLLKNPGEQLKSTEPKTPATKALLKDVLAATEKEETIEIVGDGPSEPKGKGKGKPPAKKNGKAKGNKSEPKEKKKPGIVATIMAMLEAASESKPVTKQKIHDKLVKEFPERDPKGMKSTVSGFPSWVPTEKNRRVNRTKDGMGFWLGGTAKGR